ncbi:hypothetical protein [Chitinophaga sp. CB10]|uniref:hypothetical protein n=1 Tax=Chitinophaga sp. CB10 TaxID=1891659 RepID=UPI0025BA7178|nr:hypothetical protein [Chitinophaga sp. CB10]
MGAFNVLIAEVLCPDCTKKHDGRIQFKFGNTWQLIYQVGDIIKWGGNDIGNSDLKKVKVYGIIESGLCPYCNNCNIVDEYDILIKDTAGARCSPHPEYSRLCGWEW